MERESLVAVPYERRVYGELDSGDSSRDDGRCGSSTSGPDLTNARRSGRQIGATGNVGANAFAELSGPQKDLAGC